MIKINNMTIFIILILKVPKKFVMWISRKTKFPNCNFFLDTEHDRGSLLSTLNATIIYYAKIYLNTTIILLLYYHNVASIIYNAVFLIIHPVTVPRWRLLESPGTFSKISKGWERGIGFPPGKLKNRSGMIWKSTKVNWQMGCADLNIYIPGWPKNTEVDE